MLFVVVVPTADYEQQILYGVLLEEPPPDVFGTSPPKNFEKYGHIANRPGARVNNGKNMNQAVAARGRQPVMLRSGRMMKEDVPLEKVLEELLRKLEIENAVWCEDREQHYYQVIFPREAGDETENCLHALKELGIGSRLNSIVSVSPCSVYESGIESPTKDFYDDLDESDKKAWKGFVESVRSKLTVAQVVDGVKGSAELTFDYLLLILTADMIAAVGLVENSAVNIVAAMLVSPLMSPIMAITFGTVISDRKLQLTGIKSEFAGIAMSLVFGFIFGLLVGTTDHPWGFGDWPTEEMKGRGQARSLWIGVLWALPSGTGVALALLQGSAGPLIGVAISASLLPPIVNCGMFWGLTCMKIHYGDKMKIPHLKGEDFHGNTSYKPTYSDYLPYELVSMGAISFCLFLVNIACIFTTAICVLKIKEIAAPYTSSVDLRRFWEEDIRRARDFNRASMQQGRDGASKQKKDFLPDMSRIPQENLGEALEAAVREAVDDNTFRKVKRCSYAQSGQDTFAHLIGLGGGGNNRASRNEGNLNINDPAILDQLVTALLGQQAGQNTTPHQAFNRMRPMSRSMRHGSTRVKNENSRRSSWLIGQNQGR
ncbi:UNVERIFIED_CONTAM: hypothetical protein PYX00_008109 [Menopon gallinae]|uniref:Uncharacterized protein n=1 Tax=Menopon gallinae TaxID=328185 RepID=A0AAW2HLN2_9NEOP